MNFKTYIIKVPEDWGFTSICSKCFLSDFCQDYEKECYDQKRPLDMDCPFDEAVEIGEKNENRD